MPTLGLYFDATHKKAVPKSVLKSVEINQHFLGPHKQTLGASSTLKPKMLGTVPEF